MGNIGIIGRARVGKDTTGEWFVNERGYRRVGFADPLKEAALKLDPIVDVIEHGDYTESLSELVGRVGWERAKDKNDEVRRILQHLGSAIRSLDEDFWLRLALKKTQEANDAGVPVVITDVRYRNEAASLVRAGFHLIHVERPDVPRLDHESENSLGPEDARYLVMNDGDVPGLHKQLNRIWDEIHTIESLKHAARL
ncbi:hypothetical protein PV332_10480 [Streptomyces scabiei]|uniref:deoxynucleotide monophosphate kinase family protein n=1 Tax=Streptomyces scabiei TaxID=1930 RepID=UPI0029B4F512|nr:hypothetical protein [Streptomyces scabiei]MDX2575906.1 hypothetical protein [Streptomyces scabiei]MDX2885621.1 hypothetical protein [Streptomyces scabiei]MDX2993426.1 hypothetical protein [Streptomyces scabiei]MDX3028460.1 hypothetical protein [Streptomyces scabiei]MDX3047206.1 hypothetical protein [Streptomyces scabiei]